MVNYNQTLDAAFSALADPTRRAILAKLSTGEASVTELARPHRMSLPAVMKHLRVLEGAGLVSQEKTGRVRRCRIAVKPLQQASEWLSHYRVFWENQLNALDRFLTAQQSGVQSTLRTNTEKTKAFPKRKPGRRSGSQ